MQKCHYMRVVTIRNPLHGGQTFLVVQEDDHDHKYFGNLHQGLIDGEIFSIFYFFWGYLGSF